MAHLKVLVITLIFILLCTQLSIGFAEEQDPVTELVPRFWEIPNPYYEHIEQNLPHAQELAMLIESITEIPKPLQSLVTEPVYRYLYILKPPGAAEKGIGMLECRTESGRIFRMNVPLKAVPDKKMPPISIKTEPVRIGDSIVGGKPHSAIEMITTVVPENPGLAYADGGVLGLLYYNPNDMEKWVVTTTYKDSGETKTDEFKIEGTYSNHFYQTFVVPRPQSDTEEFIKKSFSHKVELLFRDGKRITLDEGMSQTVIDPYMFEQKAPWVKFEHSREMLETMPFLLTDQTSCKSKRVWVDYRELNASEAEDFFSGEYFFPLEGKDTVHSFRIEYISADGGITRFSDYVMCYTLRPLVDVRLSGEIKENRLIQAKANPILSEFARERAEIRAKIRPVFSKLDSFAEFYRDADPDQYDEALHVEYTEHGELKIASALPGRIEFFADCDVRIDPSYVRRELPSDYFTAKSPRSDIIVIPDTPPALILLLQNNRMTRMDKFQFYSDVASLDGDRIGYADLSLYEASDPNKQLNLASPLPLGSYVLKLAAGEDSDTYPNGRSKTGKIEIPFQVDNLAPVTQLRLDAEAALPMVDIVIVTDQERHSKTISDHRTELIDFLRQHGIDAAINHWDRTVYSYSMRVDENDYTGSRYPDSSYSYSRNGYSGVLHLSNVSNNINYVDQGGYRNVKKTHGVSEYAINDANSSVVYRWSNGRWVMIKNWKGRALPSVKYISCPSGHGSVKAYKQPGTYAGGKSIFPDYDGTEGELYEAPFIFETTYEGTCTYHDRVWEPKMIEVDNYCGHYSGTVSKRISKEYAPQYRHLSDKLTIYYGTSAEADSIGRTSDQRSVFFEGNDAELPAFLLAQIEMLDIPTNTVLVRTPIVIEAVDQDLESDPIIQTSIAIQHDPNIFSEPDRQSPGYAAALPRSLEYAGKYIITRQIEDQPPVPEFKKGAGAGVEITAHRKPIADFDLEWIFEGGKYRLTLTDASYDPDFKETENRGIRRRVHRYRKKDGGDWKYRFPEELPAGEYLFSLAVQDVYGAWSEECIRELKLSSVPSIELQAKLRGLLFEADAVPAGEEIEIYDIKTKYHLAHDIVCNLQGEARRLTFDSAEHLASNRYRWDSVRIRIPETTADGSYQARVLAVSGDAQSELLLPLTVFTPIEVYGEIKQGERIELTATTNRYADKVSAVLFRNTPYERLVPLTRADALADGSITWTGTFDVGDSDIPDGNYQTLFTAETPSGKQAHHFSTDLFQFLKITSVELSGEWNLWGGDRFMGYEHIDMVIELSSAADEVEIRLSPELEAMNYRNAKGVNYSYLEEFGFTVTFPIKATADAEGMRWTASYILPIAPSSISWKDEVLRAPYKIFVTAKKGTRTVQESMELDLTGNVHDVMYIRPNLKNN